MNFLKGAIVVGLALVVAGCRHVEPPRENSAVVFLWGGFGEQGPDKVLVYVDGDVRYPGAYYLSKDVTLEDMPRIVGGWLPCRSCGATPWIVELRRRPGGLKNMFKYRYRFKRMSVDELRAVRFESEDHLIYSSAHW